LSKLETDKNYYEVLGVASNATEAEIDRSFKAKAREQHPDAGGTEEAMKLLNEAREVLANSDSRAAYDERRRAAAEPSIPYGSSAAFDHDRPTTEGLKIEVTGGDHVGLLLGAVVCIGLAIPLLVLIRMQYVFFLWPLRFLALGMLGIGVLMGHAALRVVQRHGSAPGRRGRVLLYEAGYWTGAALLGVMVYLLLEALPTPG
jgi:hypothetical protein